MTLLTLEKDLFIKNYVKLQQQINKIQRTSSTTIQNLFIQTIQIKIELLKAVKKLQTSRESIQYINQNVGRLAENYKQLKQYELKRLHLLGLNYFIFQLTPKKQGNTSNIAEMKGNLMGRQSINMQQKILTKQLLSLPTVVQYYADQQLMNQIKQSKYLYLTFIQLQTKKLIKAKRKDNKNQIYSLLRSLTDLIQQFPETIQFAKKIQVILIHLRLYNLNTSVEMSFNQAIQEILTLIVEQYSIKNQLVLSYETIIALLYNAIKILLGIDEIPVKITPHIQKIFRYHNMPTPNNYNETIFRLFLIIKIIIFSQTQSTNKAISQIRIDTKSRDYITRQNDDDQLQIQGQDPILGQTFSTFMNINLDTNVVELKEVARNIVRHRVASLATIIGFKLGIQNLAINFLQIMHDSPFNNDIQTIKLCFQLFQARQFSQLQHLFQIVLSASTCKNLKQRQVLIAMCSIFIGVYLQNREQGLLYAKLNHFQNKKHILRQQTLLQHVGFAYYNLAKSQVYLENREVYLIKALQNFKKSYQINPINYVVTYCMGKIYLKIYDYENAYKYALQSCKCNRGRWVPFALLACVYMVQRKIHKAMIIIDQLLKKYSDQTILYYIRAYIETNKILLEVEYDQQVEAAKQMDQQIYQLTKDRVLKGKSLQNLNSYCQQFYNRSRNQIKQIDQNFFNIANNFSPQNHQSQVNFYSEQLNDRKTLLMIISLFIQVQQLQTAQGLLRAIPQLQQNSQSKFYHAMIHYKRKQYTLALVDYKKILQKNNMHVDSLIQCALLDSNQAQAFNYITLAQKFNNQTNFWFAKGMVLSKLQRYEQAHQCFLKQADLGWLQQLPEKLYYY